MVNDIDDEVFTVAEYFRLVPSTSRRHPFINISHEMLTQAMQTYKFYGCEHDFT